jgi:hypothetical protein
VSAEDGQLAFAAGDVGYDAGPDVGEAARGDPQLVEVGGVAVHGLDEQLHQAPRRQPG